MINTFMTKEPRIYNGERTVSSINDAGKMNIQIKKKIKLYHYLTSHQKVKWIKDFNIRPEAIKCLEKNVGDKLLNTGLDSLNLKPKAKATAKINK